MSRSRPVPAVTRGSRGQATPLWAVVLLLAGLLLVPTGLLVRAAIDRAEARTAADAAALAGALDGESAARAVAADNGGRLVEYLEASDAVQVTVVVGDRRATARAERRLVAAVVDDPSSGGAATWSIDPGPAPERGS